MFHVKVLLNVMQVKAGLPHARGIQIRWRQVFLFYSIQSGYGTKELVFVFISAARASLSTTFKMFDVVDDKVVFLPIVAFKPSRMLFFLVCKIF